MTRNRPIARAKRLLTSLIAVVTLGAAMVAFSGSSSGQTPQPQFSGGAFGHWTKVSLFRGPYVPVGPVPDVRLPPNGADQPLTADEKAGEAVYGPAHIFGGIWPEDVGTDPPSGPMKVTTKSTGGADPSVTSTVDIGLRSPPDPKSPGGFGPIPGTQGDELHSTCTANSSGSSGSVTFKNAVISHDTIVGGDLDGEPTDIEKLPENPPPNFTREGFLRNVGDHFRIVYNEQFIDPDGSITVNGYHMYLLGDIALGDSIVGQVRCSTHGAAFANTPPLPNKGGGASAGPIFAGTEGVKKKPSSSGTSVLPFVIAGLVVVAIGAVAALLVVRRRRGAKGEPVPVDVT